MVQENGLIVEEYLYIFSFFLSFFMGSLFANTAFYEKHYFSFLPFHDIIIIIIIPIITAINTIMIIIIVLLLPISLSLLFVRFSAHFQRN